uniref:Uncharacterized protein n=1 Tax=Schistosoma mansoni TaxID=6183 RepID=A0A5K4F7S4_SCHMA
MVIASVECNKRFWQTMRLSKSYWLITQITLFLPSLRLIHHMQSVYYYEHEYFIDHYHKWCIFYLQHIIHFNEAIEKVGYNKTFKNDD